MAGIEHLQTPAKSLLSNFLRTGSSATRENRFWGTWGRRRGAPSTLGQLLPNPSRNRFSSGTGDHIGGSQSKDIVSASGGVEIIPKEVCVRVDRVDALRAGGDVC